MKQQIPNTKIFIPDRKDINNNVQLEEVIREEKAKFYKFQNSDNKNSEPIATNNNREMQGKYPDCTTVIIGDSSLNGIIQE